MNKPVKIAVSLIVASAVVAGGVRYLWSIRQTTEMTRETQKTVRREFRKAQQTIRREILHGAFRQLVPLYQHGYGAESFL